MLQQAPLPAGERATKLEQEVVGGYNREEYQCVSSCGCLLPFPSTRMSS